MVMEWQNGGMGELQNDGMAEWRNGWMAIEWRNGRMVMEWRNGGMAEWQNGGVVEWRSGWMALWSRGLKLWQWRWIAGSSCAVLYLSIASSKKMRRFTFLRTFYTHTWERCRHHCIYSKFQVHLYDRYTTIYIRKASEECRWCPQ